MSDHICPRISCPKNSTISSIINNPIFFSKLEAFSSKYFGKTSVTIFFAISIENSLWVLNRAPIASENEVIISSAPSMPSLILFKAISSSKLSSISSSFGALFFSIISCSLTPSSLFKLILFFSTLSKIPNNL